MRRAAMILLGGLFFLSAAPPGHTEPGSSNPAAAPTEGTMFETELKTSHESIPPIDRAAPATFETAAFGLG